MNTPSDIKRDQASFVDLARIDEAEESHSRSVVMIPSKRQDEIKESSLKMEQPQQINRESNVSDLRTRRASQNKPRKELESHFSKWVQPNLKNKNAKKIRRQHVQRDAATEFQLQGQFEIKKKNFKGKPKLKKLDTSNTLFYLLQRVGYNLYGNWRKNDKFGKLDKEEILQLKELLDLNYRYSIGEVIQQYIIEIMIVLVKEIDEYQGFEEYPELGEMIKAKYQQLSELVLSDELEQVNIDQERKIRIIRKIQENSLEIQNDRM